MSADLNYESEFPECGRAIHLISYPTYQNQCTESLTGCAWRIGIFDESHNVQSPGTVTYRAVFNVEVRRKIKLKGTPMYHNIYSWVVQADWLFAKIDVDARREHGPESLRE